MSLVLVCILAAALYFWCACWLGRKLREARLRNFGPDESDW